MNVYRATRVAREMADRLGCRLERLDQVLPAFTCSELAIKEGVGLMFFQAMIRQAKSLACGCTPNHACDGGSVDVQSRHQRAVRKFYQRSVQ